ncbi:MAG TPA: sigma-70 family RNA polymerase sigma factor [Pyrinomonadaceae bacterium]|nr:sigma-70 family RNA polymerase sigma factor [Pyrinomonadaceae bacterium]
MTATSPQDVTQLLAAWSDGDEAALEQLVPIIQAELHRLAKHYLKRERPGHTLQTSALVNEAYVRLINWKTARFESRAHFFGVSAQLMRRILVDFARSRPRVQGNSVRQVSLDQALAVSSETDADLVALDEALVELAERDPRKARIVELRFFGGLTVEETAEFLDISPATALREWNKAKAWLYRELTPSEQDAV